MRANDLSQPDKEALLAAIRILWDEGPNLGRPLVDTVVESRHSNMKELRPVPIADDRLDDHQPRVEAQLAKKASGKTTPKQRKGKRR